MHHIGECLSKTETRHILNWASVRSSSVAYSKSSCLTLKILAKLLNASNISFIFLIFASISMGCLILLVSLTCAGLHLQSPVHLHRRGTQCSAVVQESGGWNHLPEVTVPGTQRRPPWPRYLVQRGNRSLFTWPSYSPSHDTCWLQLIGDNLWTRVTFSG